MWCTLYTVKYIYSAYYILYNIQCTVYSVFNSRPYIGNIFTSKCNGYIVITCM